MMNNFANTICKNARIRERGYITKYQEDPLCYCPEEMHCLPYLLEEQVYCGLKSICREIITEVRKKECRERYKVFDGDKFMKQRLYKCLNKFSSGRIPVHGDRRRTSWNRFGLLPRGCGCLCACFRSEGGTDGRSRRKKRIEGGHDNSSGWDRKKKGVGKSKFNGIGFDHDHKPKKVEKSIRKSKKRDSNDKSDDGRTKGKSERKLSYNSDKDIANASDRKTKVELEEKRSRCNIDKTPEGKRGKSKIKRESADNNSEDDIGKKRNSKPKGRKRIIVQQRDGGDAKLKTNKKRGENPMAKNNYDLMKPKAVMAGKDISLSKGIEKKFSSENDRKAIGKRKIETKGNKTVMKSENENGNKKKIYGKFKSCEREEKSIDEYSEESEDSDENDDTDEAKIVRVNTSKGEVKIALISDLHMKHIKAKVSHIQQNKFYKAAREDNEYGRNINVDRKQNGRSLT